MGWWPPFRIVKREPDSVKQEPPTVKQVNARPRVATRRPAARVTAGELYSNEVAPAPMSTGSVAINPDAAIQIPPIELARPPRPTDSCERSGRYRVAFTWENTPLGDARLDLRTIHLDSPLLSTQQPYIGPLCVHELEFLRSPPGAMHTTEWVFRVTNQPLRPRTNRTTREKETDVADSATNGSQPDDGPSYSSH